MVFSNTVFLQQSKKPITFDFGQKQQVQKPKYVYLNQMTTQRRITIGDKQIMFRYILTQTLIDWLQVIIGNTLLYPVSVNDCPGPEHGIFCILIVDPIFRSSLVLFSMLRVIYYHFNKGPLKVDFLSENYARQIVMY